MSIATDVRSYADIALAQGKAALSTAGNAAVLVNKRLAADAPKPAYAALGAADLVATAVTRRVESLPTDAVSNVGRVQQTIGTLPAAARTTTEAYLSTAKDLYGKLTARGEAKAAELRKDPRVSRLLGQANEVAGSVQSTVSPVVKSAFDAVESVTESAPVRTTTARKTTARKTSAHKAPASKASAGKPATAKATARKSTTAKATARKSTAAKAPAGK